MDTAVKPGGPGPYDEEPTFRELATDWLHARELNPAVTEATTDKTSRS